MHLPGLIEIPLRLLLLIAGLLVPGTMVLRALRLPWSLAAAFVSSCAALYIAVLIFTCTSVPISLLTLGGSLGAVALVGWLIPTRNSATTHASSLACFSTMGPWISLYLAFWAVVIYRLTFQPLTGPDVYFRWSYLAEQMLRFGSLDFYPPRSGPDFVRYFWAESIPPGIASVFAWAYACGGSKHALWTSPVVALQLWSTHEVIWRLADRWGGEWVARRAVLLAAACPLLTWAFLIGQETGMTALTVAGLVWCLQNTSERNGKSWAVLAGIFAISAASTREYGPVFAAMAVMAALFMRLPFKQTLLLAAVSIPAAVAWPVRVWLLTGNPFYSLDVRGLFPINPVFAEWSEIFHRPIANTFSNTGDWQGLLRYFALWALPAMIGLLFLFYLLIRRLREARLLAGFVVLVTLVWVASIAHTAGGLFYSLRVLSPAYALLVVAAGYGLGLINSNGVATGAVSFGLAVLSLEALPKTLVLPENPYRVAAHDWPQAGQQFSEAVKVSEPALVERIRLLPAKGRRAIVTDMAGLPRPMAPIGFEVIPLWSPEVAFLFDQNITPQDAARRWQKSGLAYVAIGKGSPTRDFVRTHVQGKVPYFTVIPVVENDSLLILQAAANVTTSAP